MAKDETNLSHVVDTRAALEKNAPIVEKSAKCRGREKLCVAMFTQPALSVIGDMFDNFRRCVPWESSQVNASVQLLLYLKVDRICL